MIILDLACRRNAVLLFFLSYLHIALEIINSTDSYREFDKGNEFTLHCCFYSQPYCPIIKWYKDGKEIDQKQGQSTFQEQGRTLLRSDVDKASAGNYTCTAKTPYGEHKNHTIEVNITGKFETFVLILYHDLFYSVSGGTKNAVPPL